MMSCFKFLGVQYIYLIIYPGLLKRKRKKLFTCLSLAWLSLLFDTDSMFHHQAFIKVWSISSSAIMETLLKQHSKYDVFQRSKYWTEQQCYAPLRISLNHRVVLPYHCSRPQVAGAGGARYTWNCHCQPPHAWRKLPLWNRILFRTHHDLSSS